MNFQGGLQQTQVTYVGGNSQVFKLDLRGIDGLLLLPEAKVKDLGDRRTLLGQKAGQVGAQGIKSGIIEQFVQGIFASVRRAASLQNRVIKVIAPIKNHHQVRPEIQYLGL